MKHLQKIKNKTKNYPKFDDGRIDYTNERVCFVLNCVVVSGNKVLLTKRSANVIAYPNSINGISGFIDRADINIEEQVKNELIEELSAPISDIISLKIFDPIIQIDEEIDREWHVFGGLAVFKDIFEPKTNWENKSAKWYEISDLENVELMFGFEQILNTSLDFYGRKK